ncbi:uncharacterized protein MONBRDRAFT_26174 [Monosiga brevicollis MX1]|uniref:Uncharacterized protein n=1 Tax=Monosiga brevicollis TaxID=81824 RepID=A9V1K6_MONBE|nr:uncharacterized protein MONBRDRAFT_26174 [Monosiga brevicollis MX1]EDQ88583.1 predicted protein [Monosiga brevicollis MX1]|eukprot:XP_001746687.1 hypothetical protein [Monosiga brevicollis MX1]
MNRGNGPPAQPVVQHDDARNLEHRLAGRVDEMLGQRLPENAGARLDAQELELAELRQLVQTQQEAIARLTEQQDGLQSDAQDQREDLLQRLQHEVQEMKESMASLNQTTRITAEVMLEQATTSAAEQIQHKQGPLVARIEALEKASLLLTEYQQTLSSRLKKHRTETASMLEKTKQTSKTHKEDTMQELARFTAQLEATTNQVSELQSSMQEISNQFTIARAAVPIPATSPAPAATPPPAAGTAEPGAAVNAAASSPASGWSETADPAMMQSVMHLTQRLHSMQQELVAAAQNSYRNHQLIDLHQKQFNELYHHLQTDFSKRVQEVRQAQVTHQEGVSLALDRIGDQNTLAIELMKQDISNIERVIDVVKQDVEGQIDKVLSKAKLHDDRFEALGTSNHACLRRLEDIQLQQRRDTDEVKRRIQSTKDGLMKSMTDERHRQFHDFDKLRRRYLKDAEVNRDIFKMMQIEFFQPMFKRLQKVEARPSYVMARR